MKKYIVLTMVISLFATTGFAGGVTDNNNGNAGNIFISTGENNGANSVGTWVNASDVPELKGAKGDTGATGATGSTGSTGQNGSNGENGTDGQNGESGENGQQGEKGTQGNQGERGKGLENRTELIGEVRIFDTRKWEGNLYAGQAVLSIAFGISGLLGIYLSMRVFHKRFRNKLFSAKAAFLGSWQQSKSVK